MKAALRLIIGAVFGLTASLPASAGIIGFTGPLAPSQWIVTGATDPVTGLGYGTVDASGAPGSITLTGGDNGAVGNDTCVDGQEGPCVLTFVTNVVKSPIRFHWEYSTEDAAGPGFDIFGVLIDGVRLQLSDPGGPSIQSGNAAFLYSLSFGFYIDCTDCFFGPATVTISALQAPEPASLALLGIGLLGVAALRRRSSV